MRIYNLKLSTKFILFGILLLAAFLRFYNLNWDQGYHLHPDERAIIMKVVELRFPVDNLTSFFTPESTWNPHLFAYGSFPFYLLKIIGEGLGFLEPAFTTYGLINIAGRFMSAIFDLGTVLLIFYLGKKLHSLTVGYLSALFYAVSVLPIQLSHFYAVDTLLTFFSLAALYQLILFYDKPSSKRAMLIGVFFGMALVTKISALVLLVAIGATLVADFTLLFLKQPHRPRLWLPHVPSFLKHLIFYAVIISITTIIIFIISEPYALIDFKEFWRQTMEQSAMTHNAFTFPYTLQYVGKIPYLYELKNIFLWGMGPFSATLAFAGAIYFFSLIYAKDKHGKWAKEIIIAVFFLTYFLVVGKFAIGFMRYMLPIYPLLCLFAALAAFKFMKFLKNTIKNRFLLYALYAISYTLIFIWPLSFIHIYTQPNTRVATTSWILKNIPPGKTIAIEHWDDGLPLSGGQSYQTLTLPLYDPDTPEKWQNINSLIARTDYVIIASNRLYVPLQKLTDCDHLPPGRCYTKTTEYYQMLFSGRLGFKKVAEFTSYPTIPFINIPLNDQGADENFTVFDHPKVMIFQKIKATL
ncbi:glycosyltransferase family 39 protein [Patescibacteria group bacterium]|nr:glycosyltransferase family 39 protein [Patescibacteria group bacterium]